MTCNLFLHTSKMKQKFKIRLKFFSSSWWTFEHTWCSTRTGLRTFQNCYSTMDLSYNNVNFNGYNFNMFYCTRSIWCCIYSSSDENQVRKLALWLRSVFWNCDKLITFLSYSLPWNQTTPLGYLGEIGFFILSMELLWSVGGQVLLLFISLCKNNFVFSDMYGSFIDEFDQTDEMQDKCDLIRKLVDFHNDVKRWLNEIWFRSLENPSKIIQQIFSTHNYNWKFEIFIPFQAILRVMQIVQL